jgi:hypothetical protein
MLPTFLFCRGVHLMKATKAKKRVVGKPVHFRISEHAEKAFYKVIPSGLKLGTYIRMYIDSMLKHHPSSPEQVFLNKLKVK